MTRVLTVLVLGLAVIAASCGGGTTPKVVNPPAPTATSPPPPPPAPPPADITVVNHIVYMLQENRSFDHYFGQLNTYRQSQGAAADVDVTPANASQLSFDQTTTFTPFHMNSKCVEDLSAYWNESHNDWNHEDHTSGTPLMDGFANSAGNDSRNSAVGYDINGQRVMGYYDDTDLPYYYFMATQFAMSDKWFSPVMTNTPANRMYAMAGTSHGVVNKPLTQINIPTIFDELEQAGITWKNYVPDFPNGSSLVAISAWKDSVFFLTYDEAGGLYDHVPPVQTVSPDGIPPVLGLNDTCNVGTTGPTCDFVYTGFRLPNFVVSPFARPHYVDHTNIDTTAILRFIEIRFRLSTLSARDAAQPDISFFFDFTNKPNLNPPMPPPQPTSGPCYVTSLP